MGAPKRSTKKRPRARTTSAARPRSRASTARAALGLTVEMMALGSLVPYARNPRHNEAAVGKVAASLREFGWRQPIVVDEKMTVIAGHTRILAAQQLGMIEVPVHVARGLTPAQVKAYRLADNRTGEEAEWNDALRALELTDLATMGFDLALTGHDPDELAALLAAPSVTHEESEDVDLTPPTKPKSKCGEVYELGRHRLMCGDATESTAWDALMAGAQADMVWTDPPYGVSYEAKNEALKQWDGRLDRPSHASQVENDTLSLGGLEELLRAVLGLAWAHTRAGGSWYVAGPALAGPAWVFTIVLHDLEVVRQMLVWVKDSFVIGRSDYHGRFEALYYGWKEGAAHYFLDDRTQDTVWEIPRPRVSKEHPTMKPVALVKRAIDNSSKAGWKVVDPFGGSGTTLIAAEQSGRNAYLMELDPRYCDVIRRRYATFADRPDLAPNAALAPERPTRGSRAPRRRALAHV